MTIYPLATLHFANPPRVLPSMLANTAAFRLAAVPGNLREPGNRSGRQSTPEAILIARWC